MASFPFLNTKFNNMKEFKFFNTNKNLQTTKAIVVCAKFSFSAAQYFEVPLDYDLGELNPRDAYEKLQRDCPGQYDSFLDDEEVALNHMDDDLSFEYFDYFSEETQDLDGRPRYRDIDICN